MELDHQRTFLLSLLAARVAATVSVAFAIVISLAKATLLLRAAIAGFVHLVIAVGVVFTPTVMAQTDPEPAVIARIQTGKPNAVRALYMRAFHDEMQALGHMNGRTYVVEMHYVSRNSAKMQSQIAEIAQGKPSVLMTNGTPVTLAAKREGSPIPIVMATVGDPVGAGIVESLSQHRGNITGVSNVTGELYVKRLDIVRKIFPQMTRIGYIWTPNNRVQVAGLEDLRALGSKLGIEVKDAVVRDKSDVKKALSTLQRDGVVAIIVPPSIHRLGGEIFAKFALRERMALIYDQRRRAETGAGLFSYGANMTALYRRAAAYVDRILKGASPAELPVEQPTEFVFVVNLKSAKALGVAIPASVMLLVDGVIE